MGAILNAYQGAIEVEAGAILGAGVLMVGQGKIGDSACIGASTTILNASVDAMTVVPPGSLIGDASRQAQIHFAQAKSSAKTPKTATIDSESFPSQSPGGIEAETVIEPESSSPETEVEVSVHPAAESEKSSVVGQVYINQLLVTLFPERQAFKRSQSENSQ
jgi:carbon dioxide concentrating mechanism protein CcmN